MSSYTPTTTDADSAYSDAGATASHGGAVERRPARRISTETKSSPKSSELYAYLAAVIGVLVASAVVDNADFGPQEAWFYVTLLTIGYLVSRGLAKSGSRDFYDDDNR